MISNLSSLASKFLRKSTAVSSVKLPVVDVIRQYSKIIPWKSIGATIPLIIYFRDTFFTIYRINGSSMEPTLYNNDIVIVRKCDWGILTETFCTIFYNVFYTSSSTSSISNNNNTIDIEKERIVRQEWMSVMNNSTNKTFFDTACTSTPHYRSWIYESPILALNGHVIIFYHPNSSPHHKNNNNNNKEKQQNVQRQSNSTAAAVGSNTTIDELCIKRIIGMGGQWISIRPPNTTSNYKNNKKTTSKSNDNNSILEENNIQIQQQKRQWQELPVYTFYVEGDNYQTSIQFNDPISKHLLIGVAEYVIWPLSRFGTRINRQCSSTTGRTDDNDNDNTDPSSSKTLVRWMTT